MPVSLRTFHSSFPFHPVHTLRWQKTQPLKFLLAFCEETCPWVKVFFFSGSTRESSLFFNIVGGFWATYRTRSNPRFQILSIVFRRLGIINYKWCQRRHECLSPSLPHPPQLSPRFIWLFSMPALITRCCLSLMNCCRTFFVFVMTYLKLEIMQRLCLSSS